MKVAYLCPWRNCAENQSYFSMSAAARRLGIELIDCRVAEDVEACQPEFVISVASSIPKVADFVTYLTVHEPKKRFMESAFYLSNFLSYDGYLTISDSLERFIRDACFGAGRPEKPGFYYNTPQLSACVTELTEIRRHGELKLAYFGTNWDRRLPGLFQALDQRGILRIHGPAASWEQDNYTSYAGPLPFDGEAPQRAYSECGMGLVLLSTDHLREDVISNRIFEITSVGAVAICPAIPWIRKWFGDTVLYFDPHAPVGTLVKQIIRQVRFCRTNPDLVQEMAFAARAVFEARFAAERLLENVLTYHEEKQQARQRRLARLRENEPRISVVVRCGGRSADMVRIAVDSIRRQTFGRITVIFSKYRQIDLSDIIADKSGAIAEFVEVSIPGGNRAATLSAGLRAITTEYFAILDDDDFWLAEHFESLFSAAGMVDPSFDVAFSGVVCKSDEMTRIETGLVWDRNILTFGFRDRLTSLNSITRDIGTNSFVGRTDVLRDGLWDLPDLDSAEDSLIVAIATRRKRPVFSYKATAFLLRGFIPQSGWETLATRRDDLLTLELRSGMLHGPSWMEMSSIHAVLQAWREMPPPVQDEAVADREAFWALGEPVLSESLEEGWDLTGRMFVGAAGSKSRSGAFIARRFSKGHVCFGPYVHLPAGHYRVSFEIAPPSGLGRFLTRNSSLPIGNVDVVSVQAQWEGAAGRFSMAEQKVSIEFRVPPELQDKEIEFRIAAFGMASFEVRSVFLWHLGFDQFSPAALEWPDPQVVGRRPARASEAEAP